MILKRSVLLVLLASLILHAQEGELTLDPNDIPLTPDPTLEVPVDTSNTIQVPNLDNAIPDPQPVPDVAPAPVAPPQAAPTPPVSTPAPAPMPEPQIQEYKPTPSNLSVKPESTVDTQRKEERFSRDYTKFHKDSTSEQNWEKVVGKRTADIYVVNKGDTLWDISGTLFGDPFYWPKIWSLNKDLIYNPHVIFPDMKIKFYQGNSKATPTLATDNTNTPAPVPTTKAETVPQVKTDAPEQVTKDKNEDEDVPQNTRILAGGRKLPKTFRENTLNLKKEIEIQIEERKSLPVETTVTQEFYISESPMISSGQVVEVNNDFGSAGDGQYVFIKFEGQPSGTYSILKSGKKLRPVRDVSYDVEIYEVEGEVKVLGVVNTAENVYRAKVLKTNTLVSKGSLVIPGQMKTFKVSSALTDSTANQGRIIGTLGESMTVGQGGFVVINQGSQGGYRTNMSLPIYEELEARNRTTLKSFVKENPQRIGSLVIIDTTEGFSVGYITKITDAIAVSDIVATPEGGEFNPESAKADDIPLDTGTTPADGAPIDETAPIEEF